MRIKRRFYFLFLPFLAGLFLVGCRNGGLGESAGNINSPDNGMMSIEVVKAERIEIVHFHSTQQCRSCIAVGQYAQKAVEERFLKEKQNGKIVFRSINIDLPENREIVNKYKARGSSLFINSIVNGRDNIQEDLAVWRLIYNENQFLNYFENKLKQLLGE